MIFPEFDKKIRDKKVVSFDIFDTIIERNCLVPYDVFFIAANKLYKNKNKAIEFTKERICAEYHSRIGAIGNETTLKRIYEFMTWDKTDSDDLMQFELNTELELCKAKKSGVEKLKKAQKSGATIVLTSDMYLSKEFIEKILELCGIKYYDHIFLSNEHGKHKSNGGLFSVLKKEMNVTAEDIIHIGDDLRADFLGAKKAGIDAVLVRRNNFIKRLIFSKIKVETSLEMRY